MFLTVFCYLTVEAHMFIEFKVANFRSIRTEIALSLVANNYDTSLPDNLIYPNLAGFSKARLLKGAAIYGPNASGKSNVLAAVRFMAEFVRNSATRLTPGDPTGTVTFCLDSNSAKGASSFEVMAVIGGTRYTYCFSIDRERVHRESLVAYPKGSPQNWFERTYDPHTKDYNWDHSAKFFRLDKELCDKTRPNSLFVSTGAQFNNAQLTVVYNWFKNGLRFLNLEGESQFAPIHTAILFEENKEIIPSMMSLLKSADLGITGAEVSHEDITLDSIRDSIPPSILRKIEAETKLAGLRTPLIKFKHRAESMEDQAVDFKEESAGTRRFFSLVGPWLDILAHGYTVLVDELETSLHPMLVKEFLKLLFSAEHNPKGAQVIFTTHNPILLDNEIIRRDQVWFTEKDEHGATHLYPLTDYKPRKTESLARGYLAGRYGAIPFIPEGLKL